MKTILEGKVYQSSALEAIHVLESHGRITTLGLKAVLTVADNIRVKVPADLIHLHLPVDEVNPTPSLYFDLACKLGTSIYPLLVHCQAGVNRSRVFAALIAHKSFHTPLDSALLLADPPRSFDKPIVFESMMKWVKETS